MLNTAQEEAFILFLFSKDEISKKIYKNSPSCFTNKLPTTSCKKIFSSYHFSQIFLSISTCQIPVFSLMEDRDVREEGLSAN